MVVGLLGLHALGAVGVVALGRRLGRAAWLVAGAAPAAVVVWLIARGPSILAGDPATAQVDWVPALGVGVDLRVDAFSVLMLVLVSGIGTAVFAYGAHYFGSSTAGVRAAGLLVVFAGAMVGVVSADNLLVLYVFWELTSVTSYLLIGLHHERPADRAAATHALMVTGLGGLVMLAGFVLVGQAAGTYRISAIVEAPPSGGVVPVAVVLVLIGAFTKSAQYPFHSWLPGAMVAPTPISAYLHSAAMVKAGVYLVARLAPAFAEVGVWRPLVVTVGLVTMISGGLRALRPVDLKQLLAFGTISQLGFLVVLVGVGHPAATAAGCALLLAHGLFKAALFMVVGIVDHETGTRDVGLLPRLGRGWWVVKATAVLSAASMAGIPPLLGFLSKEEAYGAFVDGTTADRVVLAGIVVGSVLTVAYSIRFVLALVRPDAVVGNAERETTSQRPAAAFVAPAALLAVATVVLGVAPALWSGFLADAAAALDAGAHAELALWHGVTAPLVLSAVTLAAGVAVAVSARRVARLQAALAPPVTGTDVYDAVVRGVLSNARRVTGVVQCGSLPLYVGVVLATAAIAPTVAMVTGPWWTGWPDGIARPVQVPVVILIVVAAVAATVARRRFVAVVLLGAVGYGMTALFLVQGAPDLALTQFGVETLFVVVFLLVLRKLPDRFAERPGGLGRVARFVVAGAVGVFAMVMTVVAVGSRSAEPVSRSMAEQAYPDGHGRNIVNVILVDIRGFDTLGEITVLVAASLGVVAIARAGRRERTDAVEEVGS